MKLLQGKFYVKYFNKFQISKSSNETSNSCNFCGKVGSQLISNDRKGFNYSCLEVQKKDGKKVDQRKNFKTKGTNSFLVLIIHWKPLNGITLGQIETDFNYISQLVSTHIRYEKIIWVIEILINLIPLTD